MHPQTKTPQTPKADPYACADPLFYFLLLPPSVPPAFFVPYLRGESDKMTRQEKVGNALPHGILVPAVPTNQLPLHDLRLHEQMVQVLERLLVALQLLRSGRL